MEPSDDLDALLHAWARTVRIDDDEAASIRRSIVRTPAVPRSPSPTWWRDFGVQIGDVVARANRAGWLVTPPGIVSRAA